MPSGLGALRAPSMAPRLRLWASASTLTTAVCEQRGSAVGGPWGKGL